jgi:molybdenum cofactor biosynthesis protein MoaC
MFGNFKMIDVGAKAETKRTAVARGRIRVSSEAYAAIKDQKNPKGNVLPMAEVAGIMATKSASQVLPLCHPLSLQHAEIRFEYLDAENTIEVTCTATAIARTGVEMEALAGVNGALLSIYDLSKAVDPVISILEICLLEKRGGKSGHWKNPEIYGPQKKPHSFPGYENLRIGVVTVSDRASKGIYKDGSGPILKSYFSERGANVVDVVIVPDEKEQINSALRRLAIELKADIIVTTGGTGFSRRDVTPETVKEICDREIPGFGELLRSRGEIYTKSSWLSRSVAALLGDCLVICLPGSSKGVAEGVQILGDLLPHAVAMVRGEGHG